MEKTFNKIFLEFLKSRPVAYIPELAKILSSVKSALMLSQFLYWWGKGRDENEIFKTIEEIYEETGLSRSEQDTAIRLLKAKGILKMQVKGLPARRYFKIDTKKLEEIIRDYYDKK